MNGRGEILVNTVARNVAEEVVAAAAAAGARVEAGIEACTGAANLADELLKLGWHVRLAHPGYVQRLKQSPDKHDWGDARLLADLIRVNYLPTVWLAPVDLRDLRYVVRYRQQLVMQRRSAKQRVRAILRDQRLTGPGNPWTIAWREWLEQKAPLLPQSRWVLQHLLGQLDQLKKEISEVERHLQELTLGDPLVQRLLKLRGIGLVTAVTIRAEIGQADRFQSGKQLSRFCGVSPRNASSGERQADAGLIKAGNPQLRAALIEAAHRLKHFDPRWEAFAKRLSTRGKPYCVIIAAIANRWVRWLYHQMKTVSA
jgi:transposase